MPVLYGLNWSQDTNPVVVEMQFVRGNGFITVKGKQYGNGLFHHFRELQKLLWPEDDHHRWSDLMLQEILQNRITAVSGCRDSGKTHVALSRYGLTDYFTFPQETLILVSSTDLRGLQLRIWGDMKDLWRKAKERHPWLPGNVVESRYGIFTDELSDDTPVRDIRKGIICIPCLDRKGSWVGGLEKFVGIKQKRRRLLGDEVQFMHAEYLTVLGNLDKGDFKGVFVGNPIPNLKALDKISEPLEGWANHPEPAKTQVFPNRYGGRTIELVGTDSPNFDGPEDSPARYSYMVDREDERSVGNRYGRDSEQYYSQIKGVRKEGLFAHRVLTRDLCEKNRAFEKCVWEGAAPTVKVYSCDMGFGGDRAVTMCGEFGAGVDGVTILRLNKTNEIQIGLKSEPEDQIALHIREECNALGVPAANVFFDAGMRATAATALAKLFSPECNAVNFGGSPTKRPVSNDEYVLDMETQQRRLKRCDEHYNKFVTELWFSVRLAVLSRQIREMPEDVAEEFYLREWTKERGDKYEIETKKEMKTRTGMSPDLADACAILVEGARRLGFMIEQLPEGESPGRKESDYLQRELQKYRLQQKKRTLSYG